MLNARRNARDDAARQKEAMSKKFEMLQNKGTLNVSSNSFLHSFSKKLWLSSASLKKNSTSWQRAHRSMKAGEITKPKRRCSHKVLISKKNATRRSSSFLSLNQQTLLIHRESSKRWSRTWIISQVRRQPNSQRAVSCHIGPLSSKLLPRLWLRLTKPSGRLLWLLAMVAKCPNLRRSS